MKTLVLNKLAMGLVLVFVGVMPCEELRADQVPIVREQASGELAVIWFGPSHSRHHPGHWRHRRHRSHRWHDDYYDDYDRNFVLRGSTRIDDVKETDEDTTRIELDNGMTFEVEASGLPFKEDDRVNVFSKRTRGGNTKYKLLINDFEYKVYRVE